ncbi:MAG: PBP1A family penicillin-binding protein [Bacilli bacterium]|nr:PBP1A family penicillin-binding protein [Bacilli bacterium]
MKKLKVFFILVGTFLSIYLCIYLTAFLFPKLNISRNSNYYLYDINDESYSTNIDNWVSLDEISDNLIIATISIEDKNFYKHNGFDYLRIIKALYNNLKSKDVVEGASTITQQYAKNLYLNFDKTLKRKIQEAWITLRMETHYSKDEILEGYLNTINYGGVFGIENASKYYFGKSSKDLTLAEATILAGIPKSPSNYEPINNNENAKKRQLTVLNSMIKNGYINKEEATIAYNTELNYLGSSINDKPNTIMYYQDAVISELKNLKCIPESMLTTGGLKIYTNLDTTAQLSLENSIKTHMTNEQMEASGIIMNPNNGAILAIVGGTDYNKSEYNRALYSKRQVGSTMKPFLYYAALEKGMTATSKFRSEKTSFVFSNDEVYSPQNFADRYPNKDITMIEALAYSDNVYAIKTHLFLGEEVLVNMANRLGITSELEAIPSLALGSKEISLIEMVKAYATFANTGYSVNPYFIRKVVDSYGNTLYDAKEERNRILNESYVYILNDILKATYDTSLIDYEYPTCYVIKNRMTHSYSVKTGTTDSDYLIFGYNQDAIVGIWAGYDDNSYVSPTGGILVKNIWVDAIEGYLKDKEETLYEKPNDVIGVLVNPITGEVATNEDKNKRIVYYTRGTEPK